jgi:hypothetical protein
MNTMNFRPILAPLIGAALCFSVTLRPGATGRNGVLDQLRDRLVAQAVSVTGPETTGRIDIYIQRWSTDEELDSLRRTLTEGYPGGLLPAVEQMRQHVGVVLMPGVQAHGERVRMRTPKNLLFAREIMTPAGRRVIAISDEHLGLGESGLDARKEIQEFSLLDIRFAPDGKGVGKVAGASDVVYSPVTKVLEMKNYAIQPARLIDVRSEKP